MANIDSDSTETVQKGLGRYAWLFILGLFLLLAFLCTLANVLTGWVLILLRGLENMAGLEQFVVLSILAVVLLFLCGVVARRLGRARKRFEQMASLPGGRGWESGQARRVGLRQAKHTRMPGTLEVPGICLFRYALEEDRRPLDRHIAEDVGGQHLVAGCC